MLHGSIMNWKIVIYSFYEFKNSVLSVTSIAVWFKWLNETMLRGNLFNLQVYMNIQ